MQNLTAKLVKLNKWLVLAVILLVLLFLRLGIWQLDRAKQKIQLQSLIDQQKQRTAVQLCEQLDVLGLTKIQDKEVLESELQFTPVKLRAQLRGEYFLIDNQIFQGKVGYEIIQMLEACDLLFALSRGFVQANPDRNIFPDIILYENTEQLLNAALYIPGENRFIKDDLIVNPQRWPLRLSKIDFNQMQSLMGGSTQIFPAVLRLQDGHPLLYKAHWKEIDYGPQKHYAYAVQWFLFAIILVVLVLYASLKNSNERD